MLTEPGPIPVITTDWYDATSEEPGLAQFVSDQLGELDQVEADMDSYVDPAADIADELDDDGLDPALDLADVTLGQAQGYIGTLPIDETDAAKSESEEGLLNVYSVIPAEAFQAVPQPLNVSTPEESTPTANPLDVSIANLARPGAGDFIPGEEYQITARIQPGQGGAGLFAGVGVVAYPWKDDQAQPQLNIGATDQYGFLRYTSYFSSADVGAWGSTFYSQTQDGALLAGPTLYWVVNPSPSHLPPVLPPTPTPTTPPPGQGPGSPGQITVTLTNNNPSRGPFHFVVGDSWRLTVTGEAFADVTIGGQSNGIGLAPVVVGQTNAEGVFNLDGVMTQAEVGSWVETYQVGEISWNGSLGFTVTPT